MTITELLERMEHPQEGETFTPGEVQQLIDYHIDRAVKSSYNQARIASAMTEAKQCTDLVSSAMATLINLWETPQTPNLEVIVDD